MAWTCKNWHSGSRNLYRINFNPCNWAGTARVKGLIFFSRGHMKEEIITDPPIPAFHCCRGVFLTQDLQILMTSWIYHYSIPLYKVGVQQLPRLIWPDQYLKGSPAARVQINSLQLFTLAVWRGSTARILFFLILKLWLLWELLWQISKLVYIWPSHLVCKLDGHLNPKLQT